MRFLRSLALDASTSTGHCFRATEERRRFKRRFYVVIMKQGFRGFLWMMPWIMALFSCEKRSASLLLIQRRLFLIGYLALRRFLLQRFFFNVFPENFLLKLKNMIMPHIRKK